MWPSSVRPTSQMHALECGDGSLAPSEESLGIAPSSPPLIDTLGSIATPLLLVHGSPRLCLRLEQTQYGSIDTD